MVSKRPAGLPVGPEVPEDLAQAIRTIPLETLLKIRLDPLVRVVFRGQVSQVHDRILDACSRVLIEVALAKTEGNVSQSSEILGITRNTLTRRAARLGVLIEGRRARRRRGRGSV
jgi:DNA-binding NtrC family response regulator